MTPEILAYGLGVELRDAEILLFVINKKKSVKVDTVMKKFGLGRPTLYSIFHYRGEESLRERGIGEIRYDLIYVDPDRIRKALLARQTKLKNFCELIDEWLREKH